MKASYHRTLCRPPPNQRSRVGRLRSRRRGSNCPSSSLRNQMPTLRPNDGSSPHTAQTAASQRTTPRTQYEPIVSDTPADLEVLLVNRSGRLLRRTRSALVHGNCNTRVPLANSWTPRSPLPRRIVKDALVGNQRRAAGRRLRGCVVWRDEARTPRPRTTLARSSAAYANERRIDRVTSFRFGA
jgi:hypothetical protein